MAVNRAPIIVIMGHVDHGKSTLLDYIRKTNVVAGEMGGITQHLGAYEVAHNGKSITFLDTPGHAAFSAIRERGATIADIAVLVISAEEGVKAQTLEALTAIKEAGRSFIVAINKIDRPNANVEKTKQSLAENEVLVEGYGGQVPWVAISAKSGEGVTDLLDLLLVVAELENLTGDESGAGEGFILETNRDAKVGVTATIVVKDGTIATGDWLVAGSEAVKIKKLEDFLGQTIKAAPPSKPIKVYGFSQVPMAGTYCHTYKNKKLAEEAAMAEQLAKIKTEGQNADQKNWELPVVLKADVAGSLDAVEKEVKKLTRPEAGVKIISASLGPIGENDVKLAVGSKDLVVLGFNVKTDKNAKELAERFEITVETFNIIYKLSEWLEAELENRRPKEQAEEVVGEVKILKTFSRTRDKQVVGGQVTQGEFKRGKEVKIIRRGTEIGRGRVIDLEQAKSKVSTVEEGSQLGTVVESKISLAAGDVLQLIELVSK